MPITEGADNVVNYAKARQALDTLADTFLIEFMEMDWHPPAPWPEDVTVETMVCDSLLRAGFEISDGLGALLAASGSDPMVSTIVGALLKAFASTVKDTLHRLDQLPKPPCTNCPDGQGWAWADVPDPTGVNLCEFVRVACPKCKPGKVLGHGWDLDRVETYLAAD